MGTGDWREGALDQSHITRVYACIFRIGAGDTMTSDSDTIASYWAQTDS